jgi:hypothetical protein
MESLYRLPGEASTLKQTALRYLLGALGVDLLIFWIAGQLFAAVLDFHPALGRAWISVPLASSSWFGVATLPLAALTLAAAVGFLPRRCAAVFAPLALLAACLARGPLYSPFHLLLWHHKLAPLLPVAALLGPYWRSALLASASVLAGAALALVAAPSSRKPDVHGSARFAGALANDRRPSRPFPRLLERWTKASLHPL